MEKLNNKKTPHFKRSKAGSRNRVRSLDVYQKKYSPPISMLISANRVNRTDNKVYIPLYNADESVRIAESCM